MLRPESLLRALAAATLAGVVLGPLTPVQADPAAHPARQSQPHKPQHKPQHKPLHRPVDDAPLTITIDSLTPSAIPRSGPVRVSGEVTNASDDTWTTINLYPFVSEAPITTADELAAEAARPADDQVGRRITDPGPYQTIAQLAPGESASYSFAVPRRRITKISGTAPGVYWFGVHASGEFGEGRDDVADGRARTFVPLVPATTQRTVQTALVVPVRHAVRHDPDGRLSDLAEWTSTLSKDGQLRSLADFGAAAGTHPLSWLVDPAVTDAAVRLSRGNPPRSLAPTVDEGAGGDGSESPSPTDSASPSEAGSTDDGTGDEGTADPQDEATAAAMAAATDWLARLHTGLVGTEVLSLPYGDLDLAAAATHSPSTYQTARERSGGELAPWGLLTIPAVSPPSGFLPISALDLPEPNTRVLVTDRMVGGDPATVSTTAGHELLVASAGAASGGPGPDDPFAPVALRQRIVSEAALRLLTPVSQPLVVVLPAASVPSSATGFFDGLDLDWLDLTTVDQIAQRPPTLVSADRLAYPQAQRDAELDAIDFGTADDLARAGDTLQNLLTRNDEVGGQVRDEALADVSYAARTQPLRTRAAALRSKNWIDERLGSVTVEGPKAVILSSGSGHFSATITNDLDQPVTVRLKAVADLRLRVSVPDAAIDLAPGARNNVLLNASSPAIGVRNLKLELTDTEGASLGSSDTLPVRSNRVSNVIWLILGTGVALMLGAIVVRLFRRVRAARRT